MTGTRLVFMTLMTIGVETTEVEENAFKMIREKVKRSSDITKKEEFQKYSDLGKREKVQFLRKFRERKVVSNLLNVKMGVVKELEKDLFSETKQAWRKLEEVHPQGSRKWRGIRKKIMIQSEDIWKKIRKKNDSKIEWLQKKY